MATSWKSQQCDGKYYLQFETDDIDKYKLVEKASQMAIDGIAEADVVEVKHGRWIESFSFGCWHYDCSLCGEGYATKEKDKRPPNYCQDCGAKMEGGVQE